MKTNEQLADTIEAVVRRALCSRSEDMRLCEAQDLMDAANRLRVSSEDEAVTPAGIRAKIHKMLEG